MKPCPKGHKPFAERFSFIYGLDEGKLWQVVCGWYCWTGPSSKTKAGAIKEWDAVMGQIKAGRKPKKRGEG